MGLSLDNALGVHQYSMTLRARRAAILATNIVNADTPNYKARDVDFQAVLKSRMQKADSARGFNGMTSTNDRHMTGSGSLGFASNELFYRVPNQPSLDGNTVDTQVEKAKFLQNALAYQASFTFLNGRITGLIAALRGE
ncbi:MAG: flagellar basal body rod protein FlgB [Gammaproteobacteria bacterium]|nr:MAG: flagellar basal body rod protein FlgB [Gammaproteobacteria bacterium]